MTTKHTESPVVASQRHSARLSSSDDSPSLAGNHHLVASKRLSQFSKLKTSHGQQQQSNTDSSNSSGGGGGGISLSSKLRPSQSGSSQHLTLHHHHSRSSKPAELYRTDFITAMKIADTEVLDEANYFLIRDPWRLEWEKGVQVPVKPDHLYVPNFARKPDQYSIAYNNGVNNSVSRAARLRTSSGNSLHVKMPVKYLCPAFDKKYDARLHEAYLTHGLLSESSTTATLVCRYDCDDMDLSWLTRVNEEFERMGVIKLTRVDLERKLFLFLF